MINKNIKSLSYDIDCKIIDKMNKLKNIFFVLYLILCVIIGILFVINLNLIKYNKIIEKGLNNIALEIQTQNKIFSYNPNEEK